MAIWRYAVVWLAWVGSAALLADARDLPDTQVLVDDVPVVALQTHQGHGPQDVFFFADGDPRDLAVRVVRDDGSDRNRLMQSGELFDYILWQGHLLGKEWMGGAGNQIWHQPDLYDNGTRRSLAEIDPGDAVFLDRMARGWYHLNERTPFVIFHPFATPAADVLVSSHPLLSFQSYRDGSLIFVEAHPEDPTVWLKSFHPELGLHTLFEAHKSQEIRVVDLVGQNVLFIVKTAEEEGAVRERLFWMNQQGGQLEPVDVGKCEKIVPNREGLGQGGSYHGMVVVTCRDEDDGERSYGLRDPESTPLFLGEGELELAYGLMWPRETRAIVSKSQMRRVPSSQDLIVVDEGRVSYLDLRQWKLRPMGQFSLAKTYQESYVALMNSQGDKFVLALESHQGPAHYLLIEKNEGRARALALAPGATSAHWIGFDADDRSLHVSMQREGHPYQIGRYLLDRDLRYDSVDSSGFKRVVRSSVTPGGKVLVLAEKEQQALYQIDLEQGRVRTIMGEWPAFRTGWDLLALEHSPNHFALAHGEGKGKLCLVKIEDSREVVDCRERRSSHFGDQPSLIYDATLPALFYIDRRHRLVRWDL